MATYYVDPDATGAANGSSWTDAYTNLQTAVSACSGSGNTIYARGTQTLTSGGTAMITTTGIDAGTLQSPNRIIGCNASGTDDGTYFILTGDGRTNGGITTHGLSLVSNYWLAKNIACKEMSGFGHYASATGCKYINCSSSDNAREGFITASASDVHKVWFRCTAFDNAGAGFDVPRGGWLLFCSSFNNTGHGFVVYQQMFFGCVAFSNGSDGFFEQYASSKGMFYCTSHENAAHGFVSSGAEPGLFLGNRATSNTDWGISIQDSTSEIIYDFYNFAVDNTAGQINNTINAFNVLSIGSLTSGTAGYTSTTTGSEDFSLSDTATLRRTAIQIPGL